MLKMEYFNLCLLLGVQRSIHVSGRWWHHYVYSVNVRGSFKLSTGEGTVLPPGPVPARYVRQSQMCPQLDTSDKNDQKRQDMSDKARCVRQKIPKIARYVLQMCQTKMKTKCKICLTGHNYNFQALRRAFKPTYSNYTSILFNT